MRVDYLKFKKNLEKTGRTYFNIHDLKKFYPSSFSSLKVLLSCWVKKDLIYHLTRGFYSFDITRVNYLQLANELDGTSYLSFEYALYYYNLIAQVPQMITFATHKKHKIIKASHWTFEYTHLKKSLLWGYELKNKIYIASPEKALADLLYLKARGKRMVELDTLEKKKIDKKNFIKILKSFPSYVFIAGEELEIV